MGGIGNGLYQGVIDTLIGKRSSPGEVSMVILLVRVDANSRTCSRPPISHRAGGGRATRRRRGAPCSRNRNAESRGSDIVTILVEGHLTYV